MPSNRPSLQDRIRQRQQSEFVGRDDQVTLFRHNLALPLDERIYIFNVFGQGGVGKSTLLRRFREVAAGVNALTDDDQTDVLTAMDQLASELARQGQELRAFAERYRDLVSTAPMTSLHGASQDLDDYLASFPDNADAQAIRAELQAEIDRRQAEASPAPM